MANHRSKNKLKKKRKSRGGDHTINKATRESRKSKAKVSTIAIESIRRMVDLLKPMELSATYRLTTYEQMLRDDAVASAYNSRVTLLKRGQANGKFKYDINSDKSVAAYKFLKYTMDNLADQSPASLANMFGTAIKTGSALFEPSFIKGSGEYKDKWTVEKFSFINQLTLDKHTPLIISDDGNRVTHIRQSATSFVGTGFVGSNVRIRRLALTGYNDIAWNKIMSISNSATDAQPLGVSELDAAYTAWREKILLQDLTLSGAAKDLSGMPLLRIQEDILSKASDDPTSPEAAMVEQLQFQMQNLHAGDETFMIMGSDTFNEAGAGAKKMDIEFLGVSGGGKNFNMTELVEQRKKAIYNVLSSGHLLIGESDGGSYNLLEGAASLQALVGESDNDQIDYTINAFFRKLFRFNEWEITPEDMPVWVHGAVAPVSLKEVSSAIQKVGAVGLLPSKSPHFINEVLAKMDFEFRVDPSNDKWQDLMGEDESMSGSGMKEGLSNGSGKTTSSGGSRSTANKTDN